MMLSKGLALAGFFLLITGAVIALPSEDLTTIWAGAVLCWMSIPVFVVAGLVAR